MSRRFFNPTDIRWLSWQEISAVLPETPVKILVIAARSSQSRADQLYSRWLSDYQVDILPNVPADPTIDSVQSVVDSVRDTRPDWIVAIGGGSVLDTAKAASVVAKNQGDVLDHLRGDIQIQSPGIPLIAVPTTAGSGSEVTPYASITDLCKMRKVSLSHDYLYPRYAVIDPTLTNSLTRQQTAVSGMDALSHALEGYWSNQSTPVTDAHALAAAKLMLTTLANAYSDVEDTGARQSVMEGSMLAGLTISNAKTTAVHAVSYPMTVYYHIPHGLACSMLLPVLIRYNAGAMTRGKEQHLLSALGYTSMNDLAEAIEHLKKLLDMPSRLRDLGLKKADIATIVDNGFRPDRMNNNPRLISTAELTALLITIL